VLFLNGKRRFNYTLETVFLAYQMCVTQFEFFMRIPHMGEDMGI